MDKAFRWSLLVAAGAGTAVSASRLLPDSGQEVSSELKTFTLSQTPLTQTTLSGRGSPNQEESYKAVLNLKAIYDAASEESINIDGEKVNSKVGQVGTNRFLISLGNDKQLVFVGTGDVKGFQITLDLSEADTVKVGFFKPADMTKQAAWEKFYDDFCREVTPYTELPSPDQPEEIKQQKLAEMFNFKVILPKSP